MKKESKLFSKPVIGALIIVAILLVALFMSAANTATAKKEALAREAQLEAQKDAELAQAKALAEAKTKAAQEAQRLAEQEKQLAEDKALELEQALAEKEAEVTTPVEPVEAVVVPKHVEDDLSIGATVPSITLSDVKLAKLFDTEVELDNDKYNVEESVVFSGLKVANDNEDYKGEAYLEVPENGIVYKVSFDKDLTLSDIGVDDENLEITFLGSPMTIKSWVGDKIVVTRGTEVTLNEGDTVEVEGKTLTVKFISDNSEVSIDVDGETKVVSKGQSKTINDVDVFAKEVLTNRRAGMVTLKIGEEVLETIDNGDEVKGGNQDWEWIVDGTNKEIGVVLKESFEGFDSEEEFNAFGYGKAIMLPYGFLKATFTGLDSVDYQDLEMDLASKEGDDYVRVKGDFEKGLEKYDKVYVSKTTNEIFGVDADSNDLVLLGSSVLIRGTDFDLSATASSVLVVDKNTMSVRAEFLKDFSSSALDGNVLTGEEDHLSNIGIRVSNIEDALEDEIFRFKVPEEVVFATITFE